MNNAEKDESRLLELALNILRFFIQHGMQIGTRIYCCGLEFSYDENINRIAVWPSFGDNESQGIGSILTIETTYFSLIPLDPSFLEKQDDLCYRFYAIVRPYGYSYESLCDSLMVFTDDD